MQELHHDPKNEERKISNLHMALEAAMQIQKRKVIVGPNDAVGILLFNTVRTTDITFTPFCSSPAFFRPKTRKMEKVERGETEYKTGTYLYQPISQIDAPKIQGLIQLVHG